MKLMRVIFVFLILYAPSLQASMIDAKPVWRLAELVKVVRPEDAPAVFNAMQEMLRDTCSPLLRLIDDEEKLLEFSTYKAQEFKVGNNRYLLVDEHQSVNCNDESMDRHLFVVSPVFEHLATFSSNARLMNGYIVDLYGSQTNTCGNQYTRWIYIYDLAVQQTVLEDLIELGRPDKHSLGSVLALAGVTQLYDDGLDGLVEVEQPDPAKGAFVFKVTYYDAPKADDDQIRVQHEVQVKATCSASGGCPAKLLSHTKTPVPVFTGSCD